MKPFKILSSTYEASTNFLVNYKRGVIEARYVRKDSKFKESGLIPSYVACYVSSHNGCRMKCKFCHLTQNEDFSMDPVDIPTYIAQIKFVLDHYKTVSKGPLEKATKCNINFMSKGDAFANPSVVNKYPQLYQEMNKTCQEYDLVTKPNISTIMPYTVRNKKIKDIFQGSPAYMYYSLYSMNPAFREKWLPNAIPWRESLDKLKEYQEDDNTIITFHWALIKGENDNIQEVKDMAKILGEYKFNAKFNLVRFNPHKNVKDEESEKVNEIFSIIAGIFDNPKSYIVPRLDVDTKAPCGMFVEKPLQVK